MREGGRPQVQRRDPASREGQQGWGGHGLGMGFCSWTVGFYRVLIFGPAAAPRKAWQVLGSEEMQGSGWNTPVCVSSKGGERGCAAPEIPFLGGERGLADLVTSRSSSLAGWLAGWLAGYPDPEKERLSLLGDSKTVGLPLACQHLEGRGRGASSFLRGREKRERRERKREMSFYMPVAWGYPVAGMRTKS